MPTTKQINLVAKTTKARSKVGSIIMARRLEKGLSMDELANATGCTKGKLFLWETTGKIPGRGIYPRLAKALGIPLETLLADDPD